MTTRSSRCYSSLKWTSVCGATSISPSCHARCTTPSASPRLMPTDLTHQSTPSSGTAARRSLRQRKCRRGAATSGTTMASSRSRHTTAARWASRSSATTLTLTCRRLSTTNTSSGAPVASCRHHRHHRHHRHRRRRHQRRRRRQRRMGRLSCLDARCRKTSVGTGSHYSSRFRPARVVGRSPRRCSWPLLRAVSPTAATADRSMSQCAAVWTPAKRGQSIPTSGLIRL